MMKRQDDDEGAQADAAGALSDGRENRQQRRRPCVVVEMMFRGPDVIVAELFRQHGFLKMLVVDLGYRAVPLGRVAKRQKNSKVHRRSLLALAYGSYVTTRRAAGNSGDDGLLWRGTPRGPKTHPASGRAAARSAS